MKELTEKLSLHRKKVPNVRVFNPSWISDRQEQWLLSLNAQGGY